MENKITTYLNNSVIYDTYVPLLEEKLKDYSKKSQRKITIILASIPSIISNGSYPRLKQEENDHTYIYLYFIKPSNNCNILDEFHFSYASPKYVLTFSNIKKKIEVYNTINEARKAVKNISDFGIINYDVDKNNFPKGSEVVDLFKSDQGTSLDEYLDDISYWKKSSKVI